MCRLSRRAWPSCRAPTHPMSLPPLTWGTWVSHSLRGWWWSLHTAPLPPSFYSADVSRRCGGGDHSCPVTRCAVSPVSLSQHFENLFSRCLTCCPGPECSLDIRIPTQRDREWRQDLQQISACAQWRRVIFRPICPNSFMQNLRKITKNTYLQTWQIFWGSHSNSPCTIFPSPVVECKI